MAPCNTLPPNHRTLQWHPTMARQWHHVLCALQWHPGATSNPTKWFVALPPIRSKNPYSYRYLAKNAPANHSTLQWRPATSSPTMAPCKGIQQWHHVHSSKVGRHPPETIAHYNGTLQWHHVHSSKVGHHPRPHYSTLRWHPAMGPSNGTTSTSWSSPSPHNDSILQWPPAMAPRPLPQSWSSLSPPTIAHYNGTLRWHSNGTASSDPAMAPWCHVQSAKVVRRPPPLLEEPL